MRQLVNMRLPTELLARVDSVCGPRGRTEFVVRALEAALGGQGSGDTPRCGNPGVAGESAKESGSVKETAPTEDPASPQGFDLDYAAAALERQARLNAAREKKP
jgi:hypothetical protein